MLPVRFHRAQSFFPLLFLIYINVLPCSSSILAFYLFVDDTNIYCEAEDLDLFQRIVNRELKK